MRLKMRCLFSVQVVGVRETHQRQAVVADSDLTGTVHGLIEEDVHHVAVFVKQRGQHLEHARAAFPERHAAVEPANQRIQRHHAGRRSGGVTAYSTDMGFAMRFEASRISKPTRLPPAS
jgi:hypothetical protein